MPSTLATTIVVVLVSVSLTSLVAACDTRVDAAGARHQDGTHRATVVANVTLTYDVEGMHCDGCVQAITAKVTKVKGVVSCDVKLDAKTATIVVSDANVQKDVEAAITKLGYKITKKS
ncbi:MAG: heavy metal-associated domain-containing protein [Phycisphaerae bacterium]|nr:heavy metal-associated domain-containing protein [Phycisphaerae bacterium]